MQESFDVIVVGASLAGSATATFLGRRGLKVALLEKSTDPASYKKTCTHFIQPSATPTIRRLGIAQKLEAAGAVRNSMDMHTPYGGWVEHAIHEYGYSVRREKLDPIVREAAVQTPGVQLRLGQAVTELVKQGPRVVGVVTQGKDGKREELRAKLVVGADGRNSKLASMANIVGKTSENNRFMYWAYWRGLEMPHGPTRSLYWLMDPDSAYCHPCEDGLVLVAAQPHVDRLPAFRKNLEASFMRYFQAVPGAPDLTRGERVGEFRGMLQMPNCERPASCPGLALVGDAAITSDPLFGVGCGWALQSADWLNETVGDALVRDEGLDAALLAYKRRHNHELHIHHDMINSASKGAKMTGIERLLFTAASKDEAFAREFALLNTRLAHPKEAIGFGMLFRAIRAALRSKEKGLQSLNATA